MVSLLCFFCYSVKYFFLDTCHLRYEHVKIVGRMSPPPVTTCSLFWLGSTRLFFAGSMFWAVSSSSVSRHYICHKIPSYVCIIVVYLPCYESMNIWPLCFLIYRNVIVFLLMSICFNLFHPLILKYSQINMDDMILKT